MSDVDFEKLYLSRSKSRDEDKETANSNFLSVIKSKQFYLISIVPKEKPMGKYTKISRKKKIKNTIEVINLKKATVTGGKIAKIVRF